MTIYIIKPSHFDTMLLFITIFQSTALGFLLTVKISGSAGRLLPWFGGGVKGYWGVSIKRVPCKHEQAGHNNAVFQAGFLTHILHLFWDRDLNKNVLSWSTVYIYQIFVLFFFSIILPTAPLTVLMSQNVTEIGHSESLNGNEAIVSTGSGWSKRKTWQFFIFPVQSQIECRALRLTSFSFSASHSGTVVFMLTSYLKVWLTPSTQGIPDETWYLCILSLPQTIKSWMLQNVASYTSIHRFLTGKTNVWEMFKDAISKKIIII